MTVTEPKTAFLASARRTLALGSAGIAALDGAMADGLGAPFERAARVIAGASGRVIVTGMGKSGHVGQKIAATLSSTGTPAYFVHPSEASHGDLGMIRADDVILAFSWSGETVELYNIIAYSQRFSVPLIAVTSQSQSTLARAADVVLALPRADEACPHGLAPTTSTLMQLALGDCLAVALLEHKGFTAKDFKVFHPGGQLGASLKMVSELMHRGEKLPLVGHQVSVADALLIMTAKSFGCVGVVAPDGRLVGIVTDGDLRRHMGPDLLTARVDAIMTRGPKTVPPDVFASAALELLNAAKITAIFVVEADKPVGLIHIHDLLRVGVA